MLCFYTGDEARLLDVSAEELKLLMETMAKETLSSYQVTNLLDLPQYNYTSLHFFSCNNWDLVIGT